MGTHKQAWTEGGGSVQSPSWSGARGSLQQGPPPARRRWRRRRTWRGRGRGREGGTGGAAGGGEEATRSMGWAARGRGAAADGGRSAEVAGRKEARGRAGGGWRAGIWACGGRTRDAAAAWRGRRRCWRRRAAADSRAALSVLCPLATLSAAPRFLPGLLSSRVGFLLFYVLVLLFPRSPVRFWFQVLCYLRRGKGRHVHAPSGSGRLCSALLRGSQRGIPCEHFLLRLGCSLF